VSAIFKMAAKTQHKKMGGKKNNDFFRFDAFSM
jgi:hypothetical protein